jgi:hypothetical protein
MFNFRVLVNFTLGPPLYELLSTVASIILPFSALVCMPSYLNSFSLVFHQAARPKPSRDEKIKP